LVIITNFVNQFMREFVVIFNSLNGA
jgi:hypothetical protein